MTDKEKLHQIKTAKMFSGDPDFYASGKALDWLIQQAEKAQKLELEIEQDDRQGMLEDLYVENQELDKELSQTIIDQRELNGIIGELKRENMRYRETLEFYADEENYNEDYGQEMMISIDGGHRARKTLEESK